MGFLVTHWRSVVLAALASTLLVAGSTPVEAAPDGLVAAYSFDAGAGSTLTDASGAGNTGTISGATWASAGKNGGALSFDGSNDLVTVADSASLDLTTGMTLEAWVRPAALGNSWRTVVVKERPGQLNYALYAHDGGPGPSGHVNVGGADRFSAAPAVPANAWTHLATTYDGSSLKLYVNGSVATTLAASGAIATSSNPLRIGGNSIWGEWFQGLVDDVRIYSRALTQAEVQSDMTTPVGSAAPPPPSDTQAPSVPQGLRVTGSTQTSVTLAWNASSDNVGVAGYRLYRADTAVATTTQLSYTFTGLQCGTSYALSVEAYDAAGNASYRPEAVAQTATQPCATGDTQAPTAPTNLTVASTTQTSIAVTWSASTDNVGVTGYGRYRDGTLVSSATGTSYTFAGLTCGTSYALAVDAVDGAGNRSAKTQVTRSTAACSTPPPSGAQVYLSPTGSDANACTQAAPCRSLDRGYRAAAAGGVVELAAGSYGSQTVNVDASKTSTTDVVFRPASGASVTVGSTDMNAKHLELRDMVVDQVDFSNSADDVTFRNVVNHGMWWVGSSNISIIGGEITCATCASHPHMQNSGSTPPRNILFDGVYFHDWHSQAGEHVECLQILGGDGITIRNSTFKNCGTANGGLGATAALHLQAYGSGPLPRNILLENNFFYASGNPYVIQGEDFENFDLRYNSIAGPILLYNGPSAGTGMDFVGNVLRASACNAQDNAAAINWRYNVIQGGTCGSTDRNATSGFVNASSDLHLAPGAAAIDAGDPSSYPAADRDGETRPRGAAPDAGADETGATAPPPADTQAPTAPTNLRSTSATQTAIAVAWDAATDNVGVTGYGRYNGGSLVASGTGTTYTFAGLSCGTSYTLGVDAYDAAGNRSAKTQVTAATTACSSPAPPGAGSANLWLDPSGGSCTRQAVAGGYSDAQACGSMQAALDAAVAGDTVNIVDGTYGGQSLSGSKAVTFRAAGPGRPSFGQLVSSAANLTVQGIRVENRDPRPVPFCGTWILDYTLFVCAANNTYDNVVVDGMHHPSGDSQRRGGIQLDGSGTNFVFRNGEVRGVWDSKGFQGGADGMVLDNNLWTDIKLTSSGSAAGVHNECAYITAGNNQVWRRNRFVLCPIMAMFFANYAGGPAFDGVVVENNLFTHAMNEGGWHDGAAFVIPNGNDGQNQVRNWVVRYNTFEVPPSVTRTPGTGDDNGSALWYGNLGATGGCNPEWTYSYNVGSVCGGPGDVSVANATNSRNAPNQAPFYVNAPGGDFHLKAGAVPIDRADSGRYPSMDNDGKTRPVGGRADVGAYEFG